jgi:hypothetical protein
MIAGPRGAHNVRALPNQADPYADALEGEAPGSAPTSGGSHNEPQRVRCQQQREPARTYVTNSPLDQALRIAVVRDLFGELVRSLHIARKRTDDPA